MTARKPRQATSQIAKRVVDTATGARPKTKRPTGKESAVELTRQEFEVVAKLLQSKEPAKTAARMVLVEGKTISEAATEARVLQPSVSRVVRRCRETHEFILIAYAKRKKNLTT